MLFGKQSPQQLPNCMPLRTLRRGKPKNPVFDENAENSSQASLHPSSLSKASLKKNTDRLSRLPRELLICVLQWAGTNEAVKLEGLSHQYRVRISQDRVLWRMLAPQTIQVQMRKLKTIVERRSKGKLFLCECRVTGRKFTVRRIQLDVANAGQDDGVPTSILRELNH